MRKVKIDELLKECQITEAIEELKESDGETHFITFTGGSGIPVFVEFTATELMRDITRMPCLEQNILMTHLCKLLPEPGDAIVLVGSGEKKRGRSARVARLKREEEDGCVELLITR